MPSYSVLIWAALIILINSAILLVICYIGVKLSKINMLDVIIMKEHFFVTLSTVIISCVFETVVSALLFISFFFIFRKRLFRKYAFEVQRICNTYDAEANPIPAIKKVSEVFRCVCSPKTNKSLDQEYTYSISRYANNAIYIFIFFCIREIENPTYATASGTAVLFEIEYFIAITALYVVMAKLVYKISFETPSSLFFGHSTLSYIPVAVAGIICYGIGIMMFINMIPKV